MRLNELSTQQKTNPQAEQAWDAWDRQIEADLTEGKLDAAIEAAAEEAESAEAL